ncbi:MAG: glycoside hydrolase/phage tail family protein [Variibacter sp.]
MAALLLSVAGAAGGNALFGPVGAIFGRLAGALAGNVIDHALLGGARSVEGPRLADLDVMTSTEGAPIPRLYGRARLSGQVIWATRLEEVISRKNNDAVGGKGLGPKSTTTTYSYFANFAVGLCEGPIGNVARIWADGKLLDLPDITWRVYRGDETQMPDPLIVAKDGAANAPAYRGLAYIVFERLPLEKFGNRIPQLSFEVTRPIGALEPMVRAVTLIPGTTEFGYAPQTVVRSLGPGQSAPENRHVSYAASDFEASLDQLQAVCPSLARVALVVAWFGTDLRVAHCALMPGVENRTKVTQGASWAVGGLTRADAHLISSVEGRPAFGGTPSDESIVAAIAALRARGLKVTLYPFVMMDVPADNTLPDPWTGAASQPHYPWRGRITCDPAPGASGSPDGTGAAAMQIATFFGTAAPSDFSVADGQVSYAGPDEWTLRRMALHYANLAVAAGGVDAFVIGSELKGLTRVRSAPGVYPAADALAALAVDVKGIVGSDTVVTYAADWTEYGAHVVDASAQEVGFPLDAVWASPAIDAVGIDYYAPLSDWRDDAMHADRALAETIYDRAYLAGNLAAGEAYDWFYTDDSARAAQTRTPITDGAAGKPWVFRVKDFWNWWSASHFPRIDGTEVAAPTAWVPQSKPIWLTEVGCPAVDKGANQPSVFPDPKSAETGVPYFSNGGRDDLIQRRYLEAVLQSLDPALGAMDGRNPVSAIYGGRMFAPDAIHVWTWDARPYPIFPAASDVWSDGGNWETGHWLTGRLGAAPLDALVATILIDAGVANVVCDDLRDGVEGYVLDRPMAPRAAIEPLALAYAFDAHEDGASLRFRPRGSAPVLSLNEKELVLPDDKPPLSSLRAQETELPREASLGFTVGGADYRRMTALSRRLIGGSARTAHADLAIVTDAVAAERRANIWLQDLWVGRESADFALPPSLLRLQPGDVVELDAGGLTRLIEIREVVDTEQRAIKTRAIDPGVFAVPLLPAQRPRPDVPPALGPVEAVLMELPRLPNDADDTLLRGAVFASPWPGPVAIWRSIDGASFEMAALASVPNVIGETLDTLPPGPTAVWDRATQVRVRLHGGALASLSDLAVLGGGNAAAVRTSDGTWEVLQFANAELVAERTYMLSRLLRGRAGSEWAMTDAVPAGAPFVLLDDFVVPVARGLDMLERAIDLRIVAAGHDHGDPMAVALSVTAGATALRPLSPVHIRGRRTGEGVRITFIRRTRIDGDGWGAGEVPLGEASEAYEIDVLSGGDVVRTLQATTPHVLYPLADELADFGVAQSSLAVRVVQMSATVDRGFPAEAVLGALS